jgi:hypothetical protein
MRATLQEHNRVKTGGKVDASGHAKVGAKKKRRKKK